MVLCSSLVTQLCPTLCDPMDYSPPGSSVHGISQARILEWVAISFPEGSSWPRDWTGVSCLAGGFSTTEPPGKPWSLPQSFVTNMTLLHYISASLCTLLPCSLLNSEMHLTLNLIHNVHHHPQPASWSARPAPSTTNWQLPSGSLISHSKKFNLIGPHHHFKLGHKTLSLCGWPWTRCNQLYLKGRKDIVHRQAWL